MVSKKKMVNVLKFAKEHKNQILPKKNVLIAMSTLVIDVQKIIHVKIAYLNTILNNTIKY